MKKWLVIGLALLAAYMGKRAVRRNDEVLKLLWVLVSMLALSSAANTPMTRSVEQRLNALVPQVFPNTGGTINGPVTTNGTNTVNGNQTVTGNHTVGGQALVGGATGSAALEVGGSGHITANMQVDGTHAAGALQVNGASGSAAVEVGGSGHFTGNLAVDGSVTASGLVSGGWSLTGFPLAGGTVIGTVSGSNVSITTGFLNALNSIASALNNSGLT